MKGKNIQRKMLRDRSWPDSAEISRFQDFSKVSSKFSLAKSLLIKKIILASVVAIGVTATAVLAIGTKPVAEKNQQQVINSNEVVFAEPAVRPPLPEHDLPTSVYRISALNGGTIKHSTGSEIIIPPQAFVNSNGEPVADSVEISYREFHDPLDIFLSGIPMEYDSAGIVRTLESAGMIEITAKSAGQELAMDPTQEIVVKMASKNNDPKFNLYELDPATGNWIYKGKDKIEQPVTRETTRQMNATENTANTEVEMIKPAIADSKKYSFRIDYNQEQFPELAAYKNVLFETEDKNFNSLFYKVSWRDINLLATEIPGHYVIRLKRADTSITVTAKPVFAAEHYDEALKAFNEKHKQSEKARASADAKRQAALDKVNKDLTTYNRSQLTSAARMMASLTIRTFSITRLGTHNMDYPLPDITQYAIFFNTPPPDNGLRYNTVFVVEKGVNTVRRFDRNEPIKLNSRAENLIWTVTDKNQIAFFRSLDSNNGTAARPVLAPNQEEAFERIRKFSS